MHPYRYTKRELAQQFNRTRDALSEDFAALSSAGLQLVKNEQHRYAIVPDREFRELKYLQPLSDEDKAKIGRALDYLGSQKEAMYLRNKLESIYDFQRLGLRALRKPVLERIERLTSARKDRKQVILKNYRSRNSNTVRDRRVEPFHLDPEKDTLQAYDISSRDSRHFRLSRIERVIATEDDWEHTGDHRTKITDVFRIADNQQVFIHLQVDVSGYNALIEEFPLTLTYLEPANQPNSWDFQCQVNHEFIGLLPYILGNAAHVEILAPDTLAARVREEAGNIVKKFSGV
jgi:predicted DNA-binding transcriptional regulator YafY